MKRIMLDAGTTVFVLVALFAGSVLLAVGCIVGARVLGIETLEPIAKQAIEWAGLAFGGIMLALRIERRPDTPPSPPVTHYPPDETTGPR